MISRFYDKQGGERVRSPRTGRHTYKVSRHAMTVPRNSVHVNAAPSAWNGWSIHRSNCWTANSLRFDYNNVTLHRTEQCEQCPRGARNELHSDKKGSRFRYLLVYSFPMSFSRNRFTMKKKTLRFPSISFSKG